MDVMDFLRSFWSGIPCAQDDRKIKSKSNRKDRSKRRFPWGMTTKSSGKTRASVGEGDVDGVAFHYAVPGRWTPYTAVVKRTLGGTKLSTVG